jgi:hypothetical protein
MGKPSAVQWSGRLAAGWPVTFQIGVKGDEGKHALGCLLQQRTASQQAAEAEPGGQGLQHRLQPLRMQRAMADRGLGQGRR